MIMNKYRAKFETAHNEVFLRFYSDSLISVHSFAEAMCPPGWKFALVEADDDGPRERRGGPR